MALTPEIAVDDLEIYLRKFGSSLTPGARSLLMAIEQLGFQTDSSPYHHIVLSALIQNWSPLRTLLLRHGLHPEEAIDSLRRHSGSFEGYDLDTTNPYSAEGSRGDLRSRLMDFTLAAAKRHNSNIVDAADVLAGYLDECDDLWPVIENADWTDQKLHVPYNTLSHTIGTFEPSLWLEFDVIRDELGLFSPRAVWQAPVDAAPSRLKAAVMSFLADHPEYQRNCFLIMPFRQTEFHHRVATALRETMRVLGFQLLRADDRQYTDDVLTNIETYIYGCKFALAVHDRVLSNDPNPNVSLEVGYMLGQKKHVCLLKERTVLSLPSDLQGRLYVEFDAFAIESTVPKALTKWLNDKGLLPGKD